MTDKHSRKTGFFPRFLLWAAAAVLSAIPAGAAAGCNTAELQVPPVAPPESFDASRDSMHPGDAADATAPDAPAPAPDATPDANDAGAGDASDASADAIADAKQDG